MSNARGHLDIAEPNAHAALANSPAERCAARGFITPRVGDRDGDGIPDNVDKCPNEPENVQRLPRRRRLPRRSRHRRRRHPRLEAISASLEPEDKDGYLDDDGCPDLDNDADGIPDAADKCPNEPEDSDGFEDDDGCPDPDNDNDTVLDVDDYCPNTPGSPGGDKPGCPKKNMLVVVTAKEIRITQQIQFEFNKANDQGRDLLHDPRRGRAGPEGQPEDHARGPGPHRQRRQRRATT